LEGKLVVDELAIPKKDKYLVKDVSKVLGINQKTYRAWEKKGWFPKARRDRRGRIFNGEELEEIHRLKRERKGDLHR